MKIRKDNEKMIWEVWVVNDNIMLGFFVCCC